MYLYEKMNDYPLSSGVNKSCIGFDAWGNEYSREFGATTVRKDNGKCYSEIGDKISFANTIGEFYLNPVIVFKLPFDSEVNKHFVSDYFHIYKNLHVVVNKENGWSTKITTFKDLYLSHYKIPIAILLSIFVFSVTKNKRFAVVSTYLIFFMLSQFYVSFLGGGIPRFVETFIWNGFFFLFFDLCFCLLSC